MSSTIFSLLLIRSLGAVMMLAAVLARAEDFDRVRTQIREVMTDRHIPSITVAVAHQGTIVWEEGFGWANVEKRITATPHTLYSLASISKPITATALMILVERGAIDLDKPIDEYLGPQKLTARVGNSQDATVRRVASHTSGLPLHYQFFYEDESAQLPTNDEVIRRYGTLMSPPGEAVTYSNLGYGLLEYIIERTSGKSYAEFLRDELFAPLGLLESAVNRTPDFGERVAVRYMGNHPVPFYDFDTRGSAAVFMSAHDLARFGMYHLQGRLDGQQKTVLRRRTLASMLETSVLNDGGKNKFAIGWAIDEPHGLKRFSHDGAMPGVATQLSIYPDAELVIALLVNDLSAIGSLQGIEGAIVHALLPETIRKDHDFKPEPELVGRWKGAVHTFSGDVLMELDLRENGSVFARIGNGPNEEVMNVRFDPKGSLLLLDGVEGNLATPDAARYPYQLRVSLKQRAPDILNGTASAVSLSTRPDRMGSALSYWVELRKEAAGR